MTRLRALLLIWMVAEASWLLQAEDAIVGTDQKKLSDWNGKQFPTKDFNPSVMSRETGNMEMFNKSFATKSFTGFDKKADMGGKDIVVPYLDYNKKFPTKDSDLGNRKSSLGDQPLSLKLSESAWTTNQTASGFDKQFETKEYKGPEAEKLKQGWSEVTRQLNASRPLPEKDLNIDQVKALLNRNHSPMETTEPSAPLGSSTSPRSIP